MIMKPRNPWIAHRTGTPEARVRLFCFPHAGGSAAAYRGWSRYLPRHVELCPIELPGRKQRWAEAPHRSCGQLARAIASAIQPELDRPFVFFGHSLGSLLAFEVARDLRRHGERIPRHVYVSARRAPQHRIEGELLHQLPDDRMVDLLSRLYGAIPPSIAAEPDLLKPLLEALRADLEIHETYDHRPEAPLPCPISTLGGTSDRLVTMEQLRAWREQTAGPFVLKLFDGGHFYLREHERAVVQLVAADMEEAAAAA